MSLNSTMNIRGILEKIIRGNKKMFIKNEITNYGMELGTSYLTPDTIKCMSIDTRKDILEKLQGYQDTDIVVLVVTGTLVEGGVELYGIYPEEEVSENSSWSSWGSPAGYLRYVVETGEFVEKSVYWNMKG